MVKKKEEEKIVKASKKINKKQEKEKNKKKKVKTSKKSYVAEVKAELKKVVWPTKKEMTKYGIAVIGFILLFGLYFYGLDAIFAWITSLVKGL